jgi:hypothetical protein
MVLNTETICLAGTYVPAPAAAFLRVNPDVSIVMVLHQSEPLPKESRIENLFPVTKKKSAQEDMHRHLLSHEATPGE